jgi:hypothetical protein
MTEADKERLAKLIEAQRKKALMYLDADVAYGLKLALDIIREQPAEPAWIAVEEPPKQWTVAIVASTKDPSQTQQFAYFHPFEKRWYSEGATLDVTHYFLVPKLAPPDSPA